MQICYMCGRNGEQVAAQLIKETEQEIDERLEALRQEKNALSSSFGDLTAVWNSLNTRLKSLNSDIFNLNFETLEKNFGNARTNLVSEVTEFLKKSSEFRPDSFSLQDIIKNFDKYRPSNLRLDEIEKEIVQLEQARKSAAANFASGHDLLEKRNFSVKHDYLSRSMQFEPVGAQETKTDMVSISLCKICSALLRSR
ncbi:MAG: hypothetical protein KKI09_15685 [Spirochaetes bacterium]|nr:hypothetical protein [Spirochaetota bacterium]